MKKIALHGSYYGDNFGDTLFVIHFLKWIYKENEDIEVYLPFASDRVRKLVNASGIKGINSLMTAKCVVFFGGGYLGEPTIKNSIWSYRLIIRHLSIALFCYLLKKPYIFIGVGAGPLSHPIARKLTVFLCNRSKKTIVRDKESKQYLLSYGVKEEKIILTADSILTFDESNVETKESLKMKKLLKKDDNNKVTLIGVHLPATKEFENKLEVLLTDLKRYCDSLKKYKLVIFNDFYKEGYEYIAKDKIEMLFEKNEYTEVPYESPDQLIALINELDIVLTTKLHCGIVANCLNKYTLSISVHNKTKRLYEQIELSERNISLSNYESNDLDNMLKEYLANTKENVPNIIREKSFENMIYLNNFIKEYGN